MSSFKMRESSQKLIWHIYINMVKYGKYGVEGLISFRGET